MDREHIFEYLSTESPMEKYLDTRFRHITPPDTSGDLFTLLTKLPIDYDSRHIPRLTWNHALTSMQDAYGTVPGMEHNVILLKQPRLEIPEHTHTYFELIYILSGSSIHHINQNA